MSMLLTAKAFQIKVKNPIRKLILLKLADNANDFGECFPSNQYIADMCECSKTCVKNHIKALIEAGLLSKKPRYNKDGCSSNLYVLHLDGGGANGDLGGGVSRDLPRANGDLGGGASRDPITSHSINQSINHSSSAKNNGKKYKFTDDDMDFALTMWKRISATGKKMREPKLDNWANQIRLMRTSDKLNLNEIAQVFAWANEHKFWKGVILSPSNLRDKWNKLVVQANNDKQSNDQTMVNNQSVISMESDPYYGNMFTPSIAEQFGGFDE